MFIRPPTNAEILKSIKREINLFYFGDDEKTTMSLQSSLSIQGQPKIIQKPRFLVCETAGGVLSPGPNKTLQADMYRPLRLPVLLVGDAKLGGITTTISAYESLRMRGYTVHAIALIDPPGNEQFGNSEFIEHHMNSIYCDNNNNEFAWNTNDKPTVHRFSSIPTNKSVLLHDWFNTNNPAFNNLYRKLVLSIKTEYQNYIYMRKSGINHIWWPFTQHQTIKDENINFIESSHGDYFKLVSSHPITPSTTSPLSTSTQIDDLQQPGRVVSSNNLQQPLSSLSPSSSTTTLTSITTTPPTTAATVIPTTTVNKRYKDLQNDDDDDNDISITKIGSELQLQDLFDGPASWWTQAVGHGNSTMSLAIAEAAGRYGHILSPTNLHPNVTQLSKFLIEAGPGQNWASKVFYSDDGSTGMEIAIKMAFRLYETRQKKNNHIVNTTSTATNDSNILVDCEKIVIAQKDSYHGDTLGTMQTAEPNIYNNNQHNWYKPLNISIPVPLVSYRHGLLHIDVTSFHNPMLTEAALLSFPQIGSGSSTSTKNKSNLLYAMTVQDFMDISDSSPRHKTPLKQAYITYIQSFLDQHCSSNSHALMPSNTITNNNDHSNTNNNHNSNNTNTNKDSTANTTNTVKTKYVVAALLLEPIMIGAGGIKFVDPLFQNILVTACRQRGIPIVYDEVAAGMYRLGPITNSDYLRVYPDIATYGKMLSGGYLPIAATLATNEVFESFLGANKTDALLHGHSYTANPISCAAALQAIRLMQNSPLFQSVQVEPSIPTTIGTSNTNSTSTANTNTNTNHMDTTNNNNTTTTTCTTTNKNDIFMSSPRMIDTFNDEILRELSLLPGVKSVMGLGSVLAIEVAAAAVSTSTTTTTASATTGTVNPQQAQMINPTTETNMKPSVGPSVGIENIVRLLKAEGVFVR